MDINNLTLSEIKEIAQAAVGLNLTPVDSGLVNIQAPDIEVGKAYLFRTVTHIEVGEVESIHGPFVKLKNASWIADTGRYHDCLKKGVFKEVEPYPNGSQVNCASLINVATWDHELPTEQK